MGFGATVKSKQQRSLTDVFKEVEPEDLIKFGLIPELVGRMPVVAALASLTRRRAGSNPDRAKERAGQAIHEASRHGRCRAGNPSVRAEGDC